LNASLVVSLGQAKHYQNRDGCPQSFIVRPEAYIAFSSDSLTDSHGRQQETSHPTMAALFVQRKMQEDGDFSLPGTGTIGPDKLVVSIQSYSLEYMSPITG
jgi:hypothetical protein